MQTSRIAENPKRYTGNQIKMTGFRLKGVIGPYYFKHETGNTVTVIELEYFWIKLKGIVSRICGFNKTVPLAIHQKKH